MTFYSGLEEKLDLNFCIALGMEINLFLVNAPT